jgi:hypothetical protein
MAELFLGQAKFTVKIVPLASNCPKFESVRLLPYQLQSAVSAEAFQVFVWVLGGTDPALTTENMNDLLLLCEPPLSSYGGHFRALGCGRSGAEAGQGF